MSSPDSGVIHSPKASDTSPTYGADDEESRLRARLLAKKAQSSRDKVEKSPITSQQPRSVVLPPSGSKSVPKSPSRESSKHHHHHHKKKKKRRASSENEGGSGDEKSRNSVNKVAAPPTTLTTKKTQGSRRVVEIDDDIQNVINAKIAERLGSSSSVAKISATEIFDLKSRDNDDVVKNVSDEELESLGPNIQPPQASRKMTKSSEKYYHRDFKRRGEEISPESYSKRRHLDVGYGPLSSHSKMTSRHVSLHSSVEPRDKPAKSTAKTSAQEDSMHRRSREISSSRDKSDLNDDRKKRYEKQLKDYDTKKCRIESKRHKSPGHDEKRSKIESVSSEIPNEKERQNREKNRRRASEEGRISSPSPAHVTTPTQDELEDKHENDEVEHTENPPILDANSEISTEEIASGSRRRKSRSPSRGSLESGEQRSDDETEKKSSSKRQKYSKFESSSSESDSKSEVSEADIEIKEDEETVDHSENEDKDQEVTTPVHELEPEGPVAELESEDEDPLSHLPIYFPGIMGCRNVNEFHNLNRIEEGTYGVVYRAVEKRTGEIVALKRLKMEKEKEGFPITSLREINMLLKAGQCENIVKVREIVVGSNMDQIYLVMDYVEHDLKSLMETMSQHNQHFLTGEIKTLMQQLLNGVAYLHDNWILHRDLKTSNLLLSHRGILQIGDFGLAREYGSPLRQYTPIVVTLWYRAPELLLGISQYSSQIDMWSVGCIMAEMLTLKPFFTGKGDVEQLSRIFKVLGTPNDAIWPGYSDLPGLKKASFVEYPINSLRKHFGANILSEAGLKLLNNFLTYDPKKRITAQEALEDEAGWFREEPRPVPTEMFPTWPAKSERMSGAAIRGIQPRPGNLQRPADAASPKASSVAPDGGAGKRSPLGGGAFGRREITASASDNQLLRELKISGAKPSTGFSLKFDRHIF